MSVNFKLLPVFFGILQVSKTEPKVLLEYVMRIYCRNPCIGILKMKMPLKLEQRVCEMSSQKLPVLWYQDKDHGSQKIPCHLQLSRDVKKPSLLADDGVGLYIINIIFLQT